MKLNRIKNWPNLALLACGLFSVAVTGCQTDIGGQTLPSAFYLTDDVEYHPAGPEMIIPNQVRALEEYSLDQQAVREGLEEAP